MKKQKKVFEKYQISAIEEEYLQMYHEYFVLKWNEKDICKFHNCSKSKVSVAVRWVIDNKLKFPAKFLIKGAIDAINGRMKKNKELYDYESNKKRYRDNQFIIAIIKELREDEKTLFKLQEIYHADDTDEESNKLSAGQVLKLIQTAQRTKTKKN